MHRRASGEVEAAEYGGPATGIPGPAGDRVVDESCPHKEEYDCGSKSTTFSYGAGSHGGSVGEEMRKGGWGLAGTT